MKGRYVVKVETPREVSIFAELFTKGFIDKTKMQTEQEQHIIFNITEPGQKFFSKLFREILRVAETI